MSSRSTIMSEGASRFPFEYRTGKVASFSAPKKKEEEEERKRLKARAAAFVISDSHPSHFHSWRERTRRTARLSVFTLNVLINLSTPKPTTQTYGCDVVSVVDASVCIISRRKLAVVVSTHCQIFGRHLTGFGNCTTRELR